LTLRGKLLFTTSSSKTDTEPLVIPVDEAMFIDTDDFFDVLVLPQISAAVSKLAASRGHPTPTSSAGAPDYDVML
jgi:hypothetical protein